MVAISFDAGSITASLELDRAPFQQSLEQAKQEAEDFQSNTITPTLDAAEDPFDEKLADAQARLDEFGATEAAPTVGLDDEEATGKLHDLHAELDDLDATTAQARADVDDDDAVLKLDDIRARLDRMNSEVAMARVDVNDTAAKRKLAAMQVALDALGNESLGSGLGDSGLHQISSDLDELDVSLQNVATDSGNTGNGLDKASKSADNASNSFGPSGLAGAALALGPALVTIGAAGAGALIGLTGAATNAGLGMGVLALAIEPTVSAISTAATDQNTYNTALATLGPSAYQTTSALAAMETAFATLSPTEAGAAKNLADFEGSMQSWRRSFDPQVVSIFNVAISDAARILPMLTPVADSALRAISGLVGGFNPAHIQGFVTFLSGQAGPAISTFGHLMGGIGSALAKLDEDFSPLILHVEGGLDRLSGSLHAFGASGDPGAGMEHFITYVEQEGPVVAQTLEALGHDFVLLVSNAAPMGSVMLPIIRDLAVALGDIEQAAPGLVTVATAIYGVAKAASLLKAANLVSSLKGVAEVIPAFLMPAAQTETALGGMAAKAGAATVSFAAFGLGAASLAEPLGLGVVAILGLSGAMDKFSAPNAKQDTVWAQTFIQSLNGIKDPVAAVNNEMAALQDQSGRLAQQMAADRTGTKWNADQYQAWGIILQDDQAKVSDLKSAIPDLTAQQDAAGAAIAVAATKTVAALTPTQQLATYVTNLATAEAAASTALGTLTGALAVYSGNNLSAQQATLNAEGSVQAMSAALVTNKKNLDANTVGGLANRNAIVAAATAITTTLIPALANNGNSLSKIKGTVQGYITQLDTTWTKAGLTAKQVQALNAQYGLTPNDINTEITLTGASNVIAQANNAKAALNNVSGSYEAQLIIDISTYGLLGQGGDLTTKPATETQLHHAGGLPGGQPGHMSWVGEKGPELMWVPPGAVIAPHDTSMGLSAGAPGHADGLGLGLTVAATASAAVTNYQTNTYNINVDARGSTNPAAVTTQVVSGVKASLAQITRALNQGVAQ